MKNYEIAERVKKWIENSRNANQNIEVQICNTDTKEMVVTKMDPSFVIGVCNFTGVIKYEEGR